MLVAAAALALAGCGDDDSSKTSAEGAAISKGPAGNQKQGQGNAADEKTGGSTGQSTGGGFQEPRGSAPTDSGSLPNEGSRAVAPGVPLAEGGDNSIQTFGVEGPSEDRVQAARIAKAYLDARAARQFAEACSYLSGPIESQLESFAAGAQGSSGDECVMAMDGLTTGVPEAALRGAADIRVLSLRVEGKQAFLLYRDGEGTPFCMLMHLEGGVWKVGAIAGSALVL